MASLPLAIAAARSPAFGLAARAYFVYGCIYLGGAVAALGPERRHTFFGFVPWWAFYLVGAGFVVVFPRLIHRGVRWLSVLLALSVAGKALTLCFQQGRAWASGEELSPFRLGFFVVAATTAVLLFRALASGEEPPSSQQGDEPEESGSQGDPAGSPPQDPQVSQD